MKYLHIEYLQHLLLPLFVKCDKSKFQLHIKDISSELWKSLGLLLQIIKLVNATLLTVDTSVCTVCSEWSNALNSVREQGRKCPEPDKNQVMTEGALDFRSVLYRGRLDCGDGSWKEKRCLQVWDRRVLEWWSSW